MSALDEANNRNGDLLTEISRLQQENDKLWARLKKWLGEELALAAMGSSPIAHACRELSATTRNNEITFWYKNHRGENAIRFARILGLRWGTNDYYTEEQWLLRTYDYDRHAEREFAVKDMSPITADRARVASRSNAG